MTKSDETETAPLLISKELKLHSSYNAVSLDRHLSSRSEGDNTNDVTVRMEPLANGIAKPNMHIFMNGEDNPSPLPSPSPDTNVLAPQAADRITYTWHEMDVFAPGSERRRRKWYNLTKDTKEPAPMKHILKNVNGIAYPGELLAIMGSSGAGKTTLLNTLMFKSSPNVMVSGYTALNGYPVSSGTLSSLSAYVQQDDLFIGTLTVREHLVFQALVRMDRHIPYKQRMKRVEQVIAELALSKCQNTTIGIPGRIKGLSGGEMKRLSFASEVLTDPPLMFCDEPTSGLDSFMAQNVVSVLKAMANKGKTVVSTIHQPSSEVFSLFDKVLLMAEGRVAFLGSTDEACTFFKHMSAACPSNYNPADYFIELLAVIPAREDSCKQTIELICDNFQNSEIGLKIHHDTEPRTDLQMQEMVMGGWMDLGSSWKVSDSKRSPYKASWCAQMRAVFWRSWLATVKEPVFIKVRVLQTVLVGLLIGVIYYGQELNQDGVMNINGAIFVLITNMTFQNVLAVINGLRALGDHLARLVTQPTTVIFYP